MGAPGKKGIACLVLGFMLGAISFSLISGRQMEQLYREREELRVSLFETRERLMKLEDMWESRGDEVIREIIIVLDTKEDSFIELALKQAIQEIVGDLMGEKVQSLNPSLVVKMLDDRKVAAGEREFILELEAVVISETLSLYITARRVQEGPRDEP